MTPNRRLKQARELRGWSQAKVAELIGTDATTVSRWERGLFSPTPYFREKLCVLFDKNAEELGLLESARQQPESKLNGLSPLPALASPSTSLDEEWPRTGPCAGTIARPIAPSWPKRTDTFTYILHSAAHDQQAHMLWEDAYVRALRGQRAEAQQLGEASLNAFADVGHANATVVREWLNQRGFAVSPPQQVNTQPLQPLPPEPRLSEPRKRSMRRIIRGRGAGIAFILLAFATLFLVGFSFNQWYPVMRPSPVAHQSSAANKGVPAKLSPQATAHIVATAAPAATSRPSPAATKAPARPTSSFVLSATIQPASLTPHNCSLEAIGYHCTLTLWPYTSGRGPISWQVSSTNVPVQFNPGSGTIQSGKSMQIIVYIQSSPGQKSLLVFVFSSSSHTRTVDVPWQG